MKGRLYKRFETIDGLAKEFWEDMNFDEFTTLWKAADLTTC
jgi:hypothetical protein